MQGLPLSALYDRGGAPESDHGGHDQRPVVRSMPQREARIYGKSDLRTLPPDRIKLHYRLQVNSSCHSISRRISTMSCKRQNKRLDLRAGISFSTAKSGS